MVSRDVHALATLILRGLRDDGSLSFFPPLHFRSSCNVFWSYVQQMLLHQLPQPGHLLGHTSVSVAEAVKVGMDTFNALLPQQSKSHYTSSTKEQRAPPACAFLGGL